jgi:hypothetical protein
MEVKRLQYALAGPIAGLKAVVKRKHPFIAPVGNRTPAVQPVI